MSTILKITTIIIALTFFGIGFCLAGDLDDGISKFTDEPVSKDDELGQKDINTKFIILKAKQSGDAAAGGGSGNMNSVVSYGDISGDVIIIDQSKGNKTQIVGD